MIPTVAHAGAIWDRHLYRSPIPTITGEPEQRLRFVLGVDEAGRGPVLGTLCLESCLPLGSVLCQ